MKKTKMHRIVLFVIDHEDIGQNEVKMLIEDNRYISPNIKDIRTAEIGEWDDDHKLNKTKATIQDFENYFPELKQQSPDQVNKEIEKERQLRLVAEDNQKKAEREKNDLLKKLEKLTKIEALVKAIKD